ncbi:MAG: hypothetical protein RLZZ301_1843 [Bacteroidota bacterium]
MSGFEQQLLLKKQSYTATQRELLTQVLTEKYQALSVSEALNRNLQDLKDANTFTITTGHQLCLLTGPLYFIYKILHVIKLAEELRLSFPEQQFVPVYWMASEDHDFEEIRSFLLFGQKWTWESTQKGAVGRFETNDLAPLLEQLKDKFQQNPQSDIHHLLSLFDRGNYGQAFFEFVHALFNEYGLVIIDADDARFKASAWPIWEKDLYTPAIHNAIQKQSAHLLENGQTTPIASKETNLFLLELGKRERIEKTAACSYQKEDSAALSPNVVLRPLYQEWILPNLAYIGGPSEVLYWQQLPQAFTCLELPFPLVLQRAGGYLLQAKDLEQLQLLGLEKEALLTDKAALKAQYLQLQGDHAPDYKKLTDAWSAYKAAFTKIATEELPSEERMVAAELTRISKQLENLEERFEKQRKAKFDKALKQLDQLAEKIQPRGQLQERSSNILSFCPDGQVHKRIAEIYQQLDPNRKEKQWFILS